jgi:hypothetical protein
LAAAISRDRGAVCAKRNAPATLEVEDEEGARLSIVLSEPDFAYGASNRRLRNREGFGDFYDHCKLCSAIILSEDFLFRHSYF